MKKALLLNIFIIITLILSGCWNSMELNTIGIALVLGLDIEDGKVVLTAEVINPIPAKEKSSIERDYIVRYVQGVGNNIFEAFRDITLKFDRRIFISHNKVIILGEEFAKKGLIDEIDLLSRDNEQRETAYLFVAKGAKAYEVMGINNGLEEIPANYLLKLIENYKLNPKSMNIDVIHFFKDYYDMGIEPTLEIIEKKNKKQIMKMSNTSNEKYELSILGSAVFNKDRLIGYLEGNDTKGLNFIKGRVKHGIIVFPIPEFYMDKETTGIFLSEGENRKEENKDLNLNTLDIAKTKTKNDVEIIDGNIILKTNIVLRGMIWEIQEDIDITKLENIKILEDACSYAIEKGVRSTFMKAQNEFRVDIFGFGDIFHRKYPEEWAKIKHNWNEIFSQADVEIEVKTNIIRTGLTNIPANNVKGD